MILKFKLGGKAGNLKIILKCNNFLQDFSIILNLFWKIFLLNLEKYLMH